MTITHSLSGIFDINVSTMRELFSTAIVCCLDNADKDDSGLEASPASPKALNKSMLQFFDIISSIDTDSRPNSTTHTDETKNLANYGLALLAELTESAQKLGCDDSFAIFEQLSIPLAIWAAQHNLTINDIELVVNAISNTANHTQDKVHLSELIDTINVIIEAISTDIKADLDKADSGRPWRILNLNQGIIATRSQDPKRMEAVFEQLMYRLPEDAAGFFAEGMEQMDSIDYPEHVREVMQHYYHLTNKPTLH